MVKKKGKKVDLEKKAVLQARKEAKADKGTRKRLEKEARAQGVGVGEPCASDEHLLFDALLQQYKAHDRKAIQSAQIETLDGFPLARANATLTLYEDTSKKKNVEFFLFGGEYYDGIENVVLDHLLTYNVSKNEWKRLHTPKTPPPRCAHSCVYYNHALYIFGGESNIADQYLHYKDIWRFDIKAQTWEEIKPPKALGTHPTARSGHVAVVWKHYMILFGGFFEAMKDSSSPPRWYNDVYVLNLQTHEWLDVPHSKLASRPEPRSACNAAILGDDLIIHGGFSKLSSTKGIFQSRSTWTAARGGDGDTVEPTTTTTTTTTSTNTAAIASETKVHNDAWLLHLKPLLNNKPPTWERFTSSVQRNALHASSLSSKSPNGRAGTSAVAYKERLLCFGGVQDSENFHHKISSIFYADLFAFDLERRKWFPVPVKASSSSSATATTTTTTIDDKPKKRRRRRRRKSDVDDGEEEERKVDNYVDGGFEQDDNEDSGSGSDSEEENDLILEEQQGGEADAVDSGWDLEKLRSNMFAFIDGSGNLVYEKIDNDSDDTDNEDGKERTDGKKATEKVKEEGKEEEEKNEADSNDQEEKEKGKQQDTRASKTTSRLPFNLQAVGPIVTSSSVMVLNPETNKPEAVTRDQPLPRINANLVMNGNTLYVYGGILEVGDREVTLDDLWCLDLRKRDKRWICVWQGTMHKQVWRGAIHDDDDSYYSSTNDRADDDEDNEDDDDEDAKQEEKSEEKPEIKSTFNVDACGGEQTRKSKRSNLRSQIKELVDRYGMDDDTRTPRPGETLNEFHTRTADLWNQLAAAANPSVVSVTKGESSTKELKRKGFALAKQRFDQLGPAMEQLTILNLQYKEEKKASKSQI